MQYDNVNVMIKSRILFNRSGRVSGFYRTLGDSGEKQESCTLYAQPALQSHRALYRPQEHNLLKMRYLSIHDKIIKLSMDTEFHHSDSNRVNIDWRDTKLMVTITELLLICTM